MSATAERMTTAEVLRKALELLGPNGTHWGRGEQCFGGKLCAGMAIDRANRGQYRVATLYKMLIPVLDSQGTPIGWNDAPERTWPEVKAAFEKAIELAEASR